MDYFLRFVELFCEVTTLIILIRVMVSWVAPEPTNLFSRLLFQVTEPFLAPVRKLLPRTGVFDLSPLVVVVILQVISFLVSVLK